MVGSSAEQSMQLMTPRLWVASCSRLKSAHQVPGRTLFALFGRLSVMLYGQGLQYRRLAGVFPAVITQPQDCEQGVGLNRPGFLSCMRWIGLAGHPPGCDLPFPS